MVALHKVFYACIRPVLHVFCKIKFGYTYEKATGLPEKYIVLSNHNTDFDFLFVALSFPRHMYFVASEHIARWGFLSKIIAVLGGPIMRPKATVAAGTVKDILRKLKEGHNVALFAEGARSWDGRTCPILPSTGKMVKSARCGLVTYKLTGGYFVSPRWSQGGTRRGYLHGAPVRVYTAEELAAMTAREVNEAINRDLWEDAYERQMADPKPYRGRVPAEKMENLLFICPECGGYDTLRSQGDTVQCDGCGLTFRYNAYGMLEDAPFPTVRDFADWQLAQIKADAEAGKTYTGPYATLSTVGRDDSEVPVSEGAVALGPESLRCGDATIPLTSIASMDIHGRKGLVFTADSGYYELKPQENAMKFLLLYRQYASQTNETR